MTDIYGKGPRGVATKLHSLVVRSRGYCENCGESDYGKLQAAHIVSRRFSATRTDEQNAWCLCARCHFRIDLHADEKMDLARRTIGIEKFEQLKRKALTTSKMDWPAEVVRLKSLLAEIEEAAA